jgi:hypothetical protein
VPTHSSRVSVLDDIGDRDAPAGSRPWARWFVDEAQRLRQHMDFDVKLLQKAIVKLERYEAWKPLGFPTWEALCRAELDLDGQQVESIKKAREGATLRKVLEAQATSQGERSDIPNLGKSTQEQRAKANGNGIEKQRWLDALAAKRPDLLDRVRSGELKPYAAAKLAGIVRVPTPLERGETVYRALSPRDRQELRRRQDEIDREAAGPAAGGAMT